MSKSIELTADIVASYVSQNNISLADLPALIKATFDALHAIENPSATVEAAEIKSLTAGQIRKSVTPEGIISFEDGRTYQSMKRHLTGRGLTPQDYRAKWGLPKNYPMVSPNYAARRSELAKASGLGQSGRKPKAPARGGRKPKAAE